MAQPEKELRRFIEHAAPIPQRSQFAVMCKFSFLPVGSMVKLANLPVGGMFKLALLSPPSADGGNDRGDDDCRCGDRGNADHEGGIGPRMATR